MSNYVDVSKPSLIMNKLTKAQYEASSKDETELWILTDIIDSQVDLSEVIYSPSATYVNQITQHIGATNALYTNGYFYKCLAQGTNPETYKWERIDVQSAIDISGKVDKTDTANQVYGTDSNGDQTTYNKSDLSVVDDVKVKRTGTDDYTSIVSNKIANLDITGKVDHYSILPEATADRLGFVVQYIGRTNQYYTRGYFYEVVDTVTQNVSSDNISGDITVSVDANTFATSGYTYGTISFSFNGTNWVANGSSVDTSALGITIVGEPQTGDSFDIIFSEPSHAYHWDSLKIDYNDLINKPSIYGSTYIHDQAEASDEWVIQHNMGKYPSVTIVDSANTTILGTWTYDSSNQVTVHLSSASTGKAFLN